MDESHIIMVKKHLFIHWFVVQKPPKSFHNTNTFHLFNPRHQQQPDFANHE